MNKVKLLQLFLNDEGIFRLSKEKQKKYLDKFPSPKNDIDRSFYQYKCQMKSIGIVKKIMLNCAAFLGLLIQKFKHVNQHIDSKLSVDNVLLFVHDINNVTSNYRNDFVMIDDYCGKIFGIEEKKFYKGIKKRHHFSFYFLYKTKLKIMLYAFLKNKYNPKTIITSNEYSFTSSILTLYCEDNGISHIDVMHGEKIFSIRDSFFRFNKIFIWDNYYLELFKSLRSDISNYEFYLPKSRFIIPEKNKTIDLTYYLQEQGKKEMRIIAKNMRNSAKLKIAIRPHPRYTNIKNFKKIFSGFILEYPSEISFDESLSRTKCVCSLFSTILLQAHYSNIHLIIDDVSNSKKYKKLINLNYRFANQDRLSNYFERRDEEDV